MTHQLTRDGVVESCRPRDVGYVIGIRTSSYLVEHFHRRDALKIGEHVVIAYRRFTDQHAEHAFTITVKD